MEEKYTVIDKIKAFSLKNRTIVVFLLTTIILTSIGIGVSYSLQKHKPKTNEFDEMLIS